MSEATLSSYEEIPYESKPLYPTHPDCLATLATLLGMTPAPVPRCRVLELGCATGGNLIPMAATLPDSRFVGIDLSPRQIAMGREVVEALGLANVELLPLSIMDVDDRFGQFDYILCHGVYSWVPPEVQDRILTICARQLALQGVAYVSYNTYPGWHGRGVVRDLLSYHVRRFAEPQVRVQQARAFLDFLANSVPDQESTYGRLLREEANTLRPAADTYVFHEHLEDANYPLYFHEFIARAAAKGLQYLGESWYHTRFDNLAPEVLQTLQQLSEDLIQFEQYLDFLRNRVFRRTVLCHADVPLNRTPEPESLSVYALTALARPLSEQPNVLSSGVEEFRLDDGTTASSNNPLIKAALVALYEAWPRSLPFGDLWTAVQARLKGAEGLGLPHGEMGRQLLAGAMLRCYLANVVALHIHPPRFVLEVTERPAVSALARHQAAVAGRLTNLRHRLVDVNDLDRVVVQHLDGSRDRAALVQVLMEQVARKELTVQQDGQAVEDPARLREILTASLDASLQRVARSALLVG
jgi:methyltransferase-like protein/cyclopropane fatty-acyl-phospholipid synthase-like methyltransferase